MYGHVLLRLTTQQRLSSTYSTKSLPHFRTLKAMQYISVEGLGALMHYKGVKLYFLFRCYYGKQETTTTKRSNDGMTWLAAVP